MGKSQRRSTRDGCDRNNCVNKFLAMTTDADRFQDIRDGVRALCAAFPDEYFRKIDEARGYPDATD